MKTCRSLTLIAVLAVMAMMALASCDCNNDDDDSSGSDDDNDSFVTDDDVQGDDADDDSVDDDIADDDSAPDDDTTPIDDDTTPIDDDTVDDDIADDDTIDDDAADDDITDDDAVDDDTADDDTADDDAADDDTVVLDGFSVLIGDLRIDLVDGGIPGEYGLSIAMKDDGEILIAAIKARFLVLYHYNSGVVTREILTAFARFPDMKLDSQGTAHIVYIDMWNNQLKHLIVTSSTSWQEETVDTGNFADPPSIALGPDGSVHVVYYYSGEVRYANNAGGSWTVEVVDTAENANEPSIAVDAAGKAHISTIYDSQSAPNALYYFTNAYGTWQKHLVAAGMIYEYLMGSSITLDSQGIPHIAYSRTVAYGGYVDSVLYFASKVGPIWTKAQVPSPPRLPYDWDSGFHHIHLAMDAEDNAHIGYGFYHAYDAGLAQSTNASGIWLYGVVSWQDMGPVSMILDADGKPRFACQRLSDEALVYFDQESKVWNAQVIDAGADRGMNSGIAVDTQGRIHMEYLDQGSYDLYYALGQDGSWNTEIAAHQGIWYEQLAYYGSDIVVDAAGDPHIAYIYFDENNGSWLRYAKKQGSVWNIETATPEPDGYERYMALALDSNGAAHVGWSYDPARYATNAGGSWIIEYPYDPQIYGESGYYISMAVDAQNWPHIATTAGRLEFYGLAYAKRVVNGWSIEEITIDQLGELSGLSLALDSEGHAHIAMCGPWGAGPYTAQVNYLTNVSGEWEMENVDTLICGNYCDPVPISDCVIALNSAGKAHILYNSDLDVYANLGKLKYATNMNGDWRTCYLDKAGRVGDFNSIAIGADGMIHASYYGESAAWHAAFPEGYCPFDK